jgi:hypothetical protein
VRNGQIAIGSLSKAPGFASAVDPALINLAPGAAQPQSKRELAS